MGLPRKKLSTSRRDRRWVRYKLKGITLVECGNCDKLILPHRICPFCGFYEGRNVIEIKEKKEK